MLKAAVNFAKFRGQTEADLACWLRRILTQCLVDLVRRYRSASRQIAREQALDELLDRSALALGALVAQSSSGSSLPRGRDAGVLLAEALAELNEDQRQVITLRNLQQLDWNQVASKMGRTPDAVRMLWVRALKRLRPLIESRL
jgi:RNA polymerase sigma-70 factor (ECF subfamily)